MYRYFFLNIKQKEKADYEVANWIDAVNWIERNKTVPIFFGDSTVKQCLSGEKTAHAKLFCEVGTIKNKPERESCRIVTIAEGHVYVYRPSGKVKRDNKKRLLPNGKPFNPKAMPIKMITKKMISEVPLVLASMRVNQAVSRGTFFEFSNLDGIYKGNRAAVQSIIDDWEDGFKVDPLDCLSSLELETLVAKIFEEHNCFVPAYKGGYLNDIDLFVTPQKSFELCGLQLTKNETKNIQIKLSNTSDRKITNWLGKNKNNTLILLRNSNDSNPQILTKLWLRSVLHLKTSTKTYEWFQKSLHWLSKNKRGVIVKCGVWRHDQAAFL